jgi:hypothetical protein
MILHITLKKNFNIKIITVAKYHLHAEPHINTICNEAKWDQATFQVLNGQHMGKLFKVFLKGNKLGTVR